MFKRTLTLTAVAFSALMATSLVHAEGDVAKDVRDGVRDVDRGVDHDAKEIDKGVKHDDKEIDKGLKHDDKERHKEDNVVV